MNILEYAKNNIVILDGAMGSLLQKKGIAPGEKPERWNLTHPDVIIDIHKSYYDAGSNVVNTNTFGLNRFNYPEDELEKIAAAAVKNARSAADKSGSCKEKFVSFDIGPSGRMIEPMGDLPFEDAVSAFGEMAHLAEKYGADLISLETFNDSYETKAALLGVKENCSLPVFVTNAYSENENLFTGASPEAMVAMLEGLGADAVGLNCSYGPDKLMGVIKRIIACSSVPVIFKPNAGLPEVVNGETVYNLTSDTFSDYVIEAVNSGVGIIGGCCGTTPEYISKLNFRSTDISAPVVQKKYNSVVSCNTHTVLFDKLPVIIGERINPTGKKLVKEALRNNDIDYLINEGSEQLACGAHILDVNCGLPDIDEKTVLTDVVRKLQNVCNCPLQIDTSDPEALESAMRIYNGKPMVNSVNGKKEVMDSVFPLIKKYGGFLVALTLDESGIPDTAEGRYDIAVRILTEAEKYGLSRNDIVFDPLCMTIGADTNAARVTLDSVKLITERLGCKTILGVSNVSFQMPEREILNSYFYTMAMESGLSAAIINPKCRRMTDAYYSFIALSGLDDKCEKYLGYMDTDLSQAVVAEPKKERTVSDIYNSVLAGRDELSEKLTKEFIGSVEPMKIINEYVIPALNEIGERFEKKKAFLPQLLQSAKAAKACFDVVKENSSSENKEKKYPIVLATVKGDIHDIGKNIVKLLLENYGFEVIDLGKDVPPETVLEAAKQYKAPLVGLSALMTTTVPAMEETINLIHSEIPGCKVVVGGAVLTAEYAKSINADYYASDATETVKYAESLL